MIVTVLLLLLVLSFTIHIAFLASYVSSQTPERKKQLLTAFLVTGATNMGGMVGIIIVAMKYPELIQKVDLKFVLWLLSGMAFIIVFLLQVRVFVNIYRRAQDPNFYDINFFGKKVYRKGIIKQTEFISVFGTVPIFLLIGAYFVARLMNMILYGHL